MRKYDPAKAARKHHKSNSASDNNKNNISILNPLHSYSADKLDSKTKSDNFKYQNPLSVIEEHEPIAR
jgi:hypothetical protein